MSKKRTGGMLIGALTVVLGIYLGDVNQVIHGTKAAMESYLQPDDSDPSASVENSGSDEQQKQNLEPQ